MLGAAGIVHPIRLKRRHIERRLLGSEIKFTDEVYPKVETGALFGDGLMKGMRL